MPWRSEPARDLSATGIPCSDPPNRSLTMPSPGELCLSLLPGRR